MPDLPDWLGALLGFTLVIVFCIGLVCLVCRWWCRDDDSGVGD